MPAKYVAISDHAMYEAGAQKKMEIGAQARTDVAIAK
jgi:hypothetical protein